MLDRNGMHEYLQSPCIRQDKARCKRYQRRRLTLDHYSLRTEQVDVLHFAFTHTSTNSYYLSIYSFNSIEIVLHLSRLNCNNNSNNNSQNSIIIIIIIITTIIIISITENCQTAVTVIIYIIDKYEYEYKKIVT